MLKPRSLSIRSMISVAVPCLAIVLLVVPAAAQGKSGNYIFLLASGLLSDPNDPSACLAIARSSQGDSYEMTGAGTFDAQKKSVDAVGTFRHKSLDGSLLETGVWIASELVSFDPYGIDPGALPRQGLAFDPEASGLIHNPMSSGPLPTGGLAVVRIRLLPVWGPSGTAVLQVNCALGNVPRERLAEGIRLTLEGNGTDFSEEAGGRVMFLAIRPEPRKPVKGPQREPGR
jgi:hypothetical protein